jgi:AcrR family transcriptional regulator
VIGQQTVAERRATKKATIVDAAWKLARVNGIAGVSLHGVAREVGMRQPSLYEYFDSKHALYDAMFADGNRIILERLDAVTLPRDPRAALKKFMREFMAVGMEDPPRFELLFERHIPDFEPTPESYALAEQVLGRALEAINDVGITRRGDVDCVVALVAGLMASQMSNEPGGNRWTKHLDRLIDLYVDDINSRSHNR